MVRFMDIHCHLFNTNHLPMITLLRRYGAILNISLIDVPLIKIDDRVRKLVLTCEKKLHDNLTQLINEIEASFPEGRPQTIVLTPLIMYFEVEDPVKKLTQQVNDLKRAIEKYSADAKHSYVQIHPFIGVDPTRKNAVRILEKHISRPKGKIGAANGEFIGVKVYPPLNVEMDLDEHPYLNEFFKYCQTHDIPITTHASPGGFESIRLNKAEDGDLANPVRWDQILSKYPDLRVNFGHFGNLDDEWAGTIIDYLKRYKNVYTDISFFFREKHAGQVKGYLKDPQIGGKLLYGSDYPMIIPFLPSNGEYKDFLMPVKKGLDGLMDKIASENPAKFLRLP